MSHYARNRRDFEFLESLIELDDLVEIDAEVIYLMQEPTKAKAAEMYANAIDLWFREHSGSDHMENPKVKRLAIRHYW